MNFFTSILLIVVLTTGLFAQNDPQLIDFNKSRNQRTGAAIKTLGVWSVANIAASGYYYYHTTGSDKYFNQMNVMWNGINLLFVAPGLLMKEKNDFNLSKTLRLQNNIEAIYLANGILDLVYMAGGAYMTEKAKNDWIERDKWNGWGASIIMQGGFLFLLDTTMYIIHKRNGKKLYELLDKATISTSGLGIKIGIQL